MPAKRFAQAIVLLNGLTYLAVGAALLLAPEWFFANVGNLYEGTLRQQAQAFVEGSQPKNPKRLELLEPKFRQVIQSGRATAVAAPDAESQRVLAALQSIDPRWHRVLEAGGLVLMLPGNTQPGI